jgi:xylulokinase
MNFIGIDIGTSAVKAVLVDHQGALLATALVPLTINEVRPGWFEQDPVSWWEGTEKAIAQLREARPKELAATGGIGLSGQMHGLVALDAADVPVRPAILWNDGRATAECAELEAAVPGLGHIAGVPAMPGFTAPKLLWLRRNEPEAFARTAHVLLAKDYVRLKLTGEYATDVSDAAGTLLLDEAARQWSQRVLAAIGIPEQTLPRLLEGTVPSGMVRAEIARAWGLARPVVVAAGAGDVAAGAIGIGAIVEGESFLSLGTSAQIFRARAAYRPRPESLIHAFAHGVSHRWFEMAALLNGASCVEWVVGLLGGNDVGTTLARLEARFRGPSRVLFHPYLAGERTPLNDSDARGAFFNLELSCDRDELAQAVLDGLVLALMDSQAALGDESDAPLPLLGGGARSRFLAKLTASGLRRPLQLVAGAATGAAFGAARLARLAVTREAPEIVCAPPAVEETIEPDETVGAAYVERLETFRNLYKGLRAVRPARAAMADRRPRARR